MISFKESKEIDPMESKNYTVQIDVVEVEREESGIDVLALRKQEELADKKARFPAPRVEITQIDSYGRFAIKFD